MPGISQTPRFSWTSPLTLLSAPSALCARSARVSLRVLIVLAAMGGLTSVVLAHHGWSEYDATKTMTLNGTVREIRWENPHGLMRLDVTAKDATGKVWQVVLAPPSRMESRGLAKEAVKLNDVATVVGYPHKTKADEMRAERITIAGKTTELR